MEETRQPAAVGFIVNIMYRASRRPSQMSEANAEVGRRVFCIDRRRKTSCFRTLRRLSSIPATCSMIVISIPDTSERRLAPKF